ncbi:hypothetical protein CEXT_697291 [Caerostris extrusa]|uniref:Uncharacterized protein n=1 Tax=Caerostris extrusa TaxID=172846 RepID=A0AAV4YG95_CAEEX|nr:hypothetical protein CEXT_697291 [Caerostris extrusa]
MGDLDGHTRTTVSAVLIKCKNSKSCLQKDQGAQFLACIFLYRVEIAYVKNEQHFTTYVLRIKSLTEAALLHIEIHEADKTTMFDALLFPVISSLLPFEINPPAPLWGDGGGHTMGQQVGGISSDSFHPPAY